MNRAVIGTLLTAAGTGILAGLWGCALIPPNSFLDPAKVGLPPWKQKDYSEVGIRRVLTARETPPGLANATDPTDEDRVPTFEDYRIGPQDVINVSIEDFLGGNLPRFEQQIEVTPSGFLRIPQIGAIKAVGLTERELENEIRDRVRESQILAGEPIVNVITALRKNAIFNIMGSVFQPGPYQISQPDMRLLDAVSAAHGIAPEARKLYVIRQVGAARGSGPTAAPTTAPSEPGKTLPIPPPGDEANFQSSLFATLGGGNVGGQPPPSQPGSQPSRDEFEPLLAPRREAPRTRPPTQPAEEPQQQMQPQTAPERSAAPPPIIFEPESGHMREAPTQVRDSAPAAPRENRAIADPPPNIPNNFSWDIPEDEQTQRVIEIDARALQNGEKKYNIIVRNRDTIVVPTDVGIFYMMGEINRPGVFSFNSREITVKQAIAVGGGFSTLAWPSRCEIIRREPGTDKQITIPVNLDRVFANLDDDFLLKDDDIINIGSDVVAPFLFVIRNSFRLTYGFGFVYDRNYADVDSYGSKTNPEVLRQQRRLQRGLPF